MQGLSQNSGLTTSDLASRYRSDNFFFASPSATLLGYGVDCMVDADCQDDAILAAKEIFARRSKNPLCPRILVGAIPYRSDAQPLLYFPERILFGEPTHTNTNVFSPRRHSVTLKRHPVEQPSPDFYKKIVARAIETFETDALRKVVLSRSVHIEASEPIDGQALLHSMLARNQRGYTFSVPLPGAEGRDAYMFAGASPELLVRRQGRKVIANPLAGSIKRSSDLVEDRQRHEALAQSAKDLYEHQLVISFIRDVLAPHCATLNVPSSPTVIGTDSMWHLSTLIEGTLAEPAMSALELAQLIHPTPAVCGVPQADAHRFIADHESFDRGYFTGMVGWTDAEGNGEWAIAIRCAEIRGTQLKVYAGAGIVPESDPQLELMETSAKLQTMLHALGVSLDS